MVDDATLLRRYTEERSEDAFAELVHRYLDLVHSAALRRLSGDAHGAADVAQKVFISLARHGSSLARHTVLTAWLYTTTRHAALDTLRAERRRQARDLEAYTMQELATRDLPAIDVKILKSLLDPAMDELPEAARTVVLLRFFDQKPFAEVGTTLRITENAARMRTERALERLRVLLYNAA